MCRSKWTIQALTAGSVASALLTKVTVFILDRLSRRQRAFGIACLRHVTVYAR